MSAGAWTRAIALRAAAKGGDLGAEASSLRALIRALGPILRAEPAHPAFERLVALRAALRAHLEEQGDG